jgi:glycine/D-amino acid oxidase-like deaminating enzyme
VIVVGAGTAGLPCAIAAAEAGARVLLVDKGQRLGGTLHFSTGHLSAAGTSLQRELGIDDTIDQHLADLARISHGRAREDLVRQAVVGAPETLEWLLERGFDVDPETPRILYGHEPYSVARTYYGRSGGLSVLSILEQELRPWQESGAVDVWLDTAVVGLDVRLDGIEVTVHAPGRGGSVSAPYVVLATGGFAAAPDLLAQFDGAPHAVSAASPASTGDGLLLAQELGAAVAGTGRQLPGFGCLQHPNGPGRIDHSVERVALIFQERAPAEIYVDAGGRRFVAEDEPSIDRKERALAALPDWRFWCVFDYGALQGPGPRLIPGWSADDFARYAGNRPDLVSANSVRELAIRAGINPGGLVSTVAKFNRFARDGDVDPLGRRDVPGPIERAPYYALRLHGQVSVSFAGVDVDADLGVRREDGSRIDGLYAVGEIIGCAATGGDAYCGGMMVTPSLTLGRQLGQRLAQAATAPFSITPTEREEGP